MTFQKYTLHTKYNADTVEDRFWLSNAPQDLLPPGGPDGPAPLGHFDRHNPLESVTAALAKIQELLGISPEQVEVAPYLRKYYKQEAP